MGGGFSNEREISVRSAHNVATALTALGYTIVCVDPADGSFFDHRFDVAFNCLHGGWGEDGGFQAYCEQHGIPYTGPGVYASSIGFNKPIFKTMARTWGIPVPEDRGVNGPFPMVAKPAKGGSSIGVYMAMNALAWDAIVVAHPEVRGPDYMREAYHAGREITSGILTIAGEVTVLPILEIKTTNQFYDFEGKYTPGKTQLEAPASLPADVTDRVEAISRRIYKELACKGCIRVDMIITDHQVTVLEVNTSPGMTELSDIPAQAQARGMTFAEVVTHCLDSAL